MQGDYSISRIERETGISKDVLRMWERRYGFPMPSRTSGGERIYQAADLDRLLLIKRLMDLGHRPGRLMKVSDDQLRNLLVAPNEMKPKPSIPEVEHLLAVLASGDIDALNTYLRYWQLRYGAQAMMVHLLPKLLKSIGDHWQVGSMKIHQEHLMTELLQTHLRQLLTLWPSPSRTTRILLTTLPEEKHGLGLLLSENLMRMEGFSTINLGLQTPVEAIVHACRDHDVAVLSLSISEANTSSLTVNQVVMLDQQLPSKVSIWLGGEGARRLPVRGDRIKRIGSLDELLALLGTV